MLLELFLDNHIARFRFQFRELHGTLVWALSSRNISFGYINDCFQNYHPPETFRSQDETFLELISLCKCNFSSFHNFLFYASASGSFAGINF